MSICFGSTSFSKTDKKQQGSKMINWIMVSVLIHMCFIATSSITVYYNKIKSSRKRKITDIMLPL